MPDISFNKAKRERLRARYKQAVADREETFVFEGHELLTTYAKYMLQYLDTPEISGQLP